MTSSSKSLAVRLTVESADCFSANEIWTGIRFDHHSETALEARFPSRGIGNSTKVAPATCAENPNNRVRSKKNESKTEQTGTMTVRYTCVRMIRIRI
jgi:hypothetical protein